MRRLLFLCVLASGCDWDAAERQARCSAGDPAACDGGIDGGTDGGGGIPVDPTLGPVGLFPRGDAGALTLVSNTAEGGQVSWFDAQGTRVAGGRSFGDRIISAYADGVSTPVLAAIVGTSNSRLEVFFEDGGGISTPTAGHHVTIFYTDQGVYASVWSTAGAGYAQLIYPADLSVSPTALGFEACDVTLHDFEVMRAAEGARVVIPYTARSCSGQGVALGINAGTGIQSITAPGIRSPLASAGPTRIGRFFENGDAGFDVSGVGDGGQTAFIERFDWNRASSGYSQRPRRSIATAGMLELGDVSGGVIAGLSTDRVRLQGASADDGGFVTAIPTLFAAAPFAGWVRALGRGVPGSNVAVLRQGDTVFVAYLVDDGGTALVRLDATSGALLP